MKPLNEISTKEYLHALISKIQSAFPENEEFLADVLKDADKMTEEDLVESGKNIEIMLATAHFGHMEIPLHDREKMMALIDEGIAKASN